MTSDVDLTPRLRQAAEYIASRTWIKKVPSDDAGGVDIRGALQKVCTERGDFYLLMPVLRDLSRGECWNDDPRTTREDVIGFLSGYTITPKDMETTYGPWWQQVATVVRQAAHITNEQLAAISRVWLVHPSRQCQRDQSWYIVQCKPDMYRLSTHAGAAACDAVWNAVQHFPVVAPRSLWEPAGHAAWAAAAALAINDHLNDQEMTMLYGPWESVFGTAQAPAEAPAEVPAQVVA